MSESSIFDYNYTLKPFSLLRVNFWDSLQHIGKNHQIICSHILKNEPNEDNKKNDDNSYILNITGALKSLIQTDSRYFYFQFLKFNFILAQPNTLGQLKKNFHNKIFPYYLFTLLTKKKEINHMIIDFIDKKIYIYNKSKKLETILKEKIVSLMKENNNSITIILNEKNNKNIEIIPEFSIQSELIYILISFMMQIGETQKDTEKQIYSLLEDDTYIPKGILLKNYIIKTHQKKLLSKDRRYAVLGPSQIIIFKDNSMKEITNVIPLIFFGIQLKTDDKEQKIKFKYFNRKQKIQFLDNNTYEEWKKTLNNIFNKKIVEKIDGIDLYKIKAKYTNNQILDEINGEIKSIEEKLLEQSKELDEAKKEIINESI